MRGTRGQETSIPGRPVASPGQKSALAAILAVALLARLAYVALVPMPPLRYDALGYDATARRLLQHGYYAYGSIGELTERPNAVAMPGYPLFLAAAYAVDDALHAGRDLGAARAVQALLGVAVVWFVYLLGARLAGPTAGLAGAVLAAAYPPAVVVTGALWTETLFTFLLMGTLLLSLRATERPSIERFALAGVALALAAYVRPPALLWAPFAVAYVIGVVGWKRGLAYAGIAAAAVCLVMTPWWARNAAVYGRFVPFNTLTARPLLETSVPVERSGAVPNYVTWPRALMSDESALNAYWLRTALDNDAAWWRVDPRGFVALHVQRAVRQVRVPWMPLADLPPEWVSGVAETWHAVLLVLGAGAVLVLPNDRRLWLLASVPVTTFVLYSLTFPDRRYMFPNTAVLAVFAGVSLIALAERVSAEVRRPVGRHSWTGDGARPSAS